jgi:hypothetical protein
VPVDISPTFAHCQSYSLVARQTLVHASLLSARLHLELPQVISKLKALDYWWAAKQVLLKCQDKLSNISGLFKLTATISGPSHSENIGEIVKPLFDGVISALHCDPNLLCTDPAYTIFANRLGDTVPFFL